MACQMLQARCRVGQSFPLPRAAEHSSRALHFEGCRAQRCSLQFGMHPWSDLGSHILDFAIAKHTFHFFVYNTMNNTINVLIITIY